MHGTATICPKRGATMIRKPAVMLISLAAGAFLLAGCGQKGPLFLPGTPSTIRTPVPEQQPAPVEEDDEEREQQNRNPS